MSATLQAFTADDHVVFTFPEKAVSPQEREDFIAFMKAEWIARQSTFTEEHAKALAAEADAGWWTHNRQRILRAIGEA